MFGSNTYIIWLALFVGLPLIMLVVTARHMVWRQRRAMAWTLLGALVGGWAWDAGIVKLGAWDYIPEHIVGVWIGGLPLEEWLWIVGVTLMFAAVTVVLEERRPQG